MRSKSRASQVWKNHPSIASVHGHLDMAYRAIRDDALYVGSCPICDTEVLDTKDAVVCASHLSVSDGECRFRISKTLLGEEIPIEEFKKLLDEGKTSLLEGFHSPNRLTSFSATLILKEGGGLGFEFPKPAKKEEKMNALHLDKKWEEWKMNFQ
ncbi:MAG: hypothetical protein CMI32_01370 [Opitutales bacterium]|nr:hypothetical protein [Opitutales bacterium]